MLFWKITIVYNEYHMQHIDCVEIAELLNVTASGIYS